jgi:hypothetical protein
MILILAESRDDHALHVRDLLAEFGHGSRLLDTRWFPIHSTFTLNGKSLSAITLPAGEVVDTKEVTAIYWRHHNGHGLSSDASWFTANDSRAMIEAFLHASFPATTRWVNGPNAHQLDTTKPMQFRMAAAACRQLPGVHFPETIWTNCVRSAKLFAQSFKTVWKPVQVGGTAQIITPQQVSDLPACYQEHIDGRDLRVYCFATQPSATFFGIEKTDSVACAPVQVSEEIVDACIAICSALKLRFTAIDFRLDSRGAWYLDAAMTPEFLSVERATGLPLSATLCSVLADTAVGSDTAASYQVDVSVKEPEPEEEDDDDEPVPIIEVPADEEVVTSATKPAKRRPGRPKKKAGQPKAKYRRKRKKL